MRPVASLVLATLALGPALGAADGLDLSDLERAAQGNGEDATRWAQRRERMRADFAKVKALAERLTAEQRTQAWQRFLAAYADKDPYDNGDEELRRQARAALGAGAGPAKPTVDAATADPAQLERVRQAYQQAKAIDLHPGQVAARSAAWEAFLAEHGADLAGTTADDDMRRWARIRLDALAQDPPVLLSPLFRVAPGFAVGDGTRVSAIEPGSLAARLGLQPGDTIIAAGDPPHDLIGNQEALGGYIADLRREADFRVVVIRNNTVVAMPAGPARPAARGAVPARGAAQLGVRCLQNADGLVVGAVDAGQLAEAAGLDAGDRIDACNRTPVATMDALDAAFTALAAEAPLELDVLRCGALHRVSIPAAGGAASWSVVEAAAGWAAAPAPPPVASAPAAPAAVDAKPAVAVAKPAAADAKPAVADAKPVTTGTQAAATTATAAAAERERASIAHPADPARVGMALALGLGAAGVTGATAAPTSAKPAIDLGLQYEARDDGVLRVTARAPNGIAGKLGVQVGDLLVGAGEPSRLVRSWTYDRALASCTDAASTRLVVARSSASSGKSVRRVSILPLPPPPEERVPRGPGKPFTAIWGLGFGSFDIVPIVVSTNVGDLAEAAGLMPGDRITAIGGRTTAILDDVREALQLADTAPPALRLAVTTWNGVDWFVDLPRAGGLAVWQRAAPAPPRH